MNMTDIHNSSGMLKSVNGQESDSKYQVSISVDKYNDIIIKIFDAEKDFVDAKEHSFAVVALNPIYEGNFVTLYSLSRMSTETVQNESIQELRYTLKFRARFAIIGKSGLSDKSIFDSFSFRITDGFELIGLCPYNLENSIIDIRMNKRINIPVSQFDSNANTSLGSLAFSGIPVSAFHQNGLMFGFDHRILFESIASLTPFDFHGVFSKITDFFSLLCGEFVTINELQMCGEVSSKTYDFIGYNHFPRSTLNLLRKGNGFDGTCKLRVRLFKVSDFPDIGKAFDTWFSYYADDKKRSLMLAHNAYGRILMDEELEILTENRFLATMQLVEGYYSAFYDIKEELAKFKEKKKQVVEILKKDGNADLVKFAKQSLSHLGSEFREKLTRFLYDGISIFEDIDLESFRTRNDDLIVRIKDDRNLYTHSSDRKKPVFDILELSGITYVCKLLYRANMLKRLGVPEKIIRHRLSFDDSFAFYVKSLFNVDIKSEKSLLGFDAKMRFFSK